MRYSRKHEPSALARMGALVAGDWVADLRAGHAAYLRAERGNPKAEQLAEIFVPAYIAQFLHLGEPGWEALAETYAWMAELAHKNREARGLRGEDLFLPLAECRLYAPLRPGKLVAVLNNYPDPARAGTRQGGVPGAFVKLTSAIVGPGRDIVKPSVCEMLECEAELAIVIGRRCKGISAERALEYVAGYTILNDVTARDVVERERLGGNLLLGKSYDTFAPLGPWLVTRDEIADPMRLHVRTRVNGSVLREGSTAEMVHSVATLISYFSQMSLMPGDIIATGSPRGGSRDLARSLVAADRIECEIEGIGVLRNAVVDEGT
jgi:acylpyruvate hydrolase